jgi:transposase
MAQVRLSMRKIRQVLRLRWELGFSARNVAQSLSVSHSTVLECETRARRAGLTWPLDPKTDDVELERLLYPPPEPRSRVRPIPDWAEVWRELRGHKGVTLQLLWLEYKKEHPHGYQYSQYCERFRRWRDRVDVVMRQTYRAGEKCFCDWAGIGIQIVDSATGEIREAPVFVGTLGASNYFYVEATEDTKLKSWIEVHIRMLEFFGGSVELLIPDNEKTAATQADYYEPVLNETYQEMAAHYGASALPTRPYHPRDKAKVETSVQIAERWILAPLRKQTFFNVQEANQAIWALLEEALDRPFQTLPGTRRELFETLEKPALRPLPARRYEIGYWKKVKAGIDYHVKVADHFYSVPYQLAGKKMEARYTDTTVEVFYGGRRVAAHARSYKKGGFTTLPGHMPAAHRRHMEWSPDRLVRWGAKIGEQTARMVRRLMESRPHPEQGYRSCLGLLRLERTYGQERLEAACERALKAGASSYRSVNSILKTGLDRRQEGESIRLELPAAHANLRGADYYQTQGEEPC